MTLKQAIEKFRNEQVSSTHWLYLDYSPYKDIHLNSEAELAVVGFDEMSGSETFSAECLARCLHATLDFDAVSECIAHADRLMGAEDDEAAADVIRYAVRFDRLPDHIGEDDPVGIAEQRRGPVYALYDSLGPEDQSKPCRTEGCNRGSVRFSVFCRRHHCENVLRYPCPLTH